MSTTDFAEKSAAFERLMDSMPDRKSVKMRIAPETDSRGYAPIPVGEDTGFKRAATPIPLDAPKPVEIPAGAFSGWLADTIQAVAIATETPPELGAMFALAAISTAIQGKVRIEIRPGYYEPINLWLICALQSASRKTAVMTKMIEPVGEWEDRQRGELLPLIEKAKSEQKTIDVRIAKLRTEAAKASSQDEFNKLKEEIAELEANPIVIPAAPQLFTQDVTPEHTGTMLADNGERLAIISDEGGIFDILGGRYSDNIPNIDVYLQSHAGSYVRVNRGSRPAVNLKHPALTIGVSPQPDIVRGLASHKGFRGRGLLARFLYMMPPSPVGYRSGRTTAVPDATSNFYREEMSRLLDLKVADDGMPHLLKLRPDARDLWDTFWREVELSMRPGGQLEHITDWGGKLPGAVARIAGLLHCASYASAMPNVMEVELRSMQQAVLLGRFFIDHALIAFDLMGADVAMDAARDLWKQIEKMRKPVFTIREAWHPLRGKYHRVKDVEDGFDVLIDHDYISEPHQADDDAPLRRGRPPSRQFEVNELISASWS